MIDEYVIYISNRDLLSNSRIRHAVEGAKVNFFAEDDGHTEHASWIRCSIRWPDAVATIDRLDARSPDLAANLHHTCRIVNESADGDVDVRRGLIHEKLLRSHNVLRVSGPPETSDRLKILSRAIAAGSNGLLLHESSLSDPHGRLCLGPDGAFDAESGWETLPSAHERKARTEERMRSSGIPVSDPLPPIESDEEGLLRPPWEVARRASALVTVAARAEGLEQQRAIQFLQAWGLWEAASPREQAFLMNPHPAETERIQFLWRYECLWVMLWALGHIEKLNVPSSICDVRRAVKLVTGTSTDVFIGKSQLRPLEEVLDEADFIYRCHGAVKNAQVRGETVPGGLDSSVVIERLVALSWLRNYHSQSWDDVSPDR